MSRGSKADRFATALARKAPQPEHQAAAVATMERAGQGSGAPRPDMIAPSALTPSPYQPVGRPSRAAIAEVRAAIGTGSVAALLDGETPAVTALGKEARELALLAADVQARGLDVPLEARRTGQGLELLSGHRRLAAALLAGVSAVPVVTLGPLTDAEAAELVYRRNRMREDFAPWQEARSILALGIARQAAGQGAPSNRALAKVAGYSHVHVGELLNIARAWLDEQSGAPLPGLERLGGRDGAAGGEEVLAGLSFRQLRALAALPLSKRLAEARALAGQAARPEPATPTRPRQLGYDLTDSRGRWSLSMVHPIERLQPAQLRALHDDLQALARTVAKQLRTATKASP